MKKMLVALVLVTLPLFAATKSTYDLSQPHYNSLAKTFGQSFVVQNDAIEFSMIDGGYFTIGTNHGLTENDLDEKCQFTYGHPYALTSFPVFALDGDFEKPEHLFGFDRFVVNENGDELLAASPNSGDFQCSFTMKEDDAQEGKVNFVLSIANKKTTNQTVGIGLVFDPAIGKWNDGYVKINDSFVTDQTSFADGNISEIELWERNTNALGLGGKIIFDENPSTVLCDNWHFSYENCSPELTTDAPTRLFDALLKIFWENIQLGPEESKTITFSFELVPPDFSSEVFMRWDAQYAYSLTDGQLFPREQLTNMQITNLTNTDKIQCNFVTEAESGLIFQGPSAVFDLAGNATTYQKLALDSKIIYEDLVVSATTILYEGWTLLDQFTRNIYIPATPVSDEGLIVNIDSSFIDNFGQAGIVFNVEKEETGQKILNIAPENIFLYEEESRVSDFTIEKEKSKGATLADVVFVMDCSGSMNDEIAAVKNNIGEFADSLVARGYDFQIGVITFSTTVDDVWDLTNNVAQIKSNLASVTTWGGTEDSPAALYRATELSLRPGSKRIVVWSTDESYPEYTYTKTQIVNRMLEMDMTVHGVGLTDLQTDWFNPIVLPTGGKFYNINGNFRDILLDVSRLESYDRYLLSFNPSKQNDINMKLKIHYAGLGGQARFILSRPGSTSLSHGLACFPNPFNPSISFTLPCITGLNGDLAIYNVLGQRIKHYDLNFGDAPAPPIRWNARDDLGRPVSAGVYFVQMRLFDANGLAHVENKKIMYVK